MNTPVVWEAQIGLLLERSKFRNSWQANKKIRCWRMAVDDMYISVKTKHKLIRVEKNIGITMKLQLRRFEASAGGTRMLRWTGWGSFLLPPERPSSDPRKRFDTRLIWWNTVSWKGLWEVIEDPQHTIVQVHTDPVSRTNVSGIWLTAWWNG